MSRGATSRGHSGKIPITLARPKKRAGAAAPSQKSRHFTGISLPSADFVKRAISQKSIAAHALATFGSKEKAQHWMNRPNPLFHGKTPAQVTRIDPVGVEAELVRIDHGVYV
jgi:uncharacterized protein (DUF2384 family)